jgi:hypothetical protein
MLIPENPLELPEKDQIKYLDGIKGFKNQVIDFQFILGLKREGDYHGFVECIQSLSVVTDYAGLHCTDVNWYEEGNYQTGILEPGLWESIDTLGRVSKNLSEEHTLSSTCNFTDQPRGFQRFIGAPTPVRRPDLMVPFEGGLFDRWGQFIQVYIVEGISPFYLNTDSDLIKKIKDRAKLVGKREQTDEEWEKEYIEDRKKDKEREEAIERYWEEESKRWSK